MSPELAVLVVDGGPAGANAALQARDRCPWTESRPERSRPRGPSRPGGRHSSCQHRAHPRRRDVTGHALLVQSARFEGQIAAENAVLGPERRGSHHAVPSASFTAPEHGQVSLIEAAAAPDQEIVVGIARCEDLVRPVADGVAATCMISKMSVESIAELPFAVPTFTKGVSMAAQKICRTMGVSRFSRGWSDFGPDE